MHFNHSDPLTLDGGQENNPRPSKSHIKREMHALLDLGRQLIELSPDRIRCLPLEEKLVEAIFLAQKITSHEGRRRQVHYVGKLMRYACVDAIRAQLETYKHGSRTETIAMHQLESLRDRLLLEDQALTELLHLYPKADIQSLHTLVRAARKEAQANMQLLPSQTEKRKYYRALFQALKKLTNFC